jgi:LEA14-like dessication related protein
MDILRFGGKWTFRILIPIILVAGALFYFGQGLQDASLDRFDVTGIDDITTESFTILGNLFVKNPSEISVPIDIIEYDIFLKETGEKIGSGTLPTFTLEKSTTNKIAFNQKMRWIPTAQLAVNLLTKEKVIIEIKGKLRINVPKVKEYSIPFSQETDIQEYVGQFVPNPIEQPLPIGGAPSVPIEDQPDDSPSNDPYIPDTPLSILN